MQLLVIVKECDYCNKTSRLYFFMNEYQPVTQESKLHHLIMHFTLLDTHLLSFLTKLTASITLYR